MLSIGVLPAANGRPFRVAVHVCCVLPRKYGPVDVDVVAGRLREGVVVRPRRRVLARDPVGDDRDRARLVRAAEHVQVRVVRGRIFRDQRRLPVTGGGARARVEAADEEREQRRARCCKADQHVSVHDACRSFLCDGRGGRLLGVWQAVSRLIRRRAESGSACRRTKEKGGTSRRVSSLPARAVTAQRGGFVDRLSVSSRASPRSTASTTVPDMSRFPAAVNEQIAREFAASQQYVAVATYFDAETLPQLAAHFYRQAVEERNHAMMLVQYLLDAGERVVVPGVEAPKVDFADAVEPVALALEQEREVTRQIAALVQIAREENDLVGEQFLHWFLQ